MPLTYEAIIFDCDGTLVDSEYLVTEVVVDHARPYGIDLTTDEALRRFKGRRMADCVAELEMLRGGPFPASFVPEIRQLMSDALASKLQPIEGALDLVRSLSIPFCVASNGPRDKIELSLSVTGLLSYFEGRIFSAYETGTWKPDPGLFLHAARSMGAQPSRCAVIEDSLPGIEAGIAAGMTVYALIDEHSRSQLPEGVQVISGLRELQATMT
jgi:HAD superfamily hydrolase (TIGR01509 family)